MTWQRLRKACPRPKLIFYPPHPCLPVYPFSSSVHSPHPSNKWGGGKINWGKRSADWMNRERERWRGNERWTVGNEGDSRGVGGFSPLSQCGEAEGKSVRKAALGFAGWEPRTNVAISTPASQRVPDLGKEQDPHIRDHDPANSATGFPGPGPAIKPQPEPTRGHCCIMASLQQVIKAQVKCAKCLCHWSGL